MQLNDTHLILLSAAAQRDDKLLDPPAKLGVRALEKLATRFETAGLVEAIAVTSHQPHWRASSDGELIGLQLTRASFDALGIEFEAHVSPNIANDGLAESAAVTVEGDDAAGERTDRPLIIEPLRGEASEGEASQGGDILSRPGSKRALLIVMLQREEGASVEAIMAVMGWLPHSTRAALTGLRKTGYAVARGKDANGLTIYHLGARTNGELLKGVAE